MFTQRYQKKICLHFFLTITTVNESIKCEKFVVLTIISLIFVCIAGIKIMLNTASINIIYFFGRN